MISIKAKGQRPADTRRSGSHAWLPAALGAIPSLRQYAHPALLDVAHSTRTGSWPLHAGEEAQRTITGSGRETTGQRQWTLAKTALDGMGHGAINIAYKALERDVITGHGDDVATRWLGREGARHDLNYAQLNALAARFAKVLAVHAVGPGDSVFAMMGARARALRRSPWHAQGGAVFTPLLSAFGPEPIRTRMEIGAATALVNSASICVRKIVAWRHEIPSLRLVLIAGDTAPEGCVALGLALAAASDQFDTVATGLEAPALIHFTSGTTGRPKGAVRVHNAVNWPEISGREALSLSHGTTTGGRPNPAASRSQTVSAWRLGPARWASRCPASRPRSSRVRTGGYNRWPMARWANWRCAPAGRG